MTDLTREQVFDVIFPVVDSFADANYATDAVMALLAEAPPSPYVTTVRDELEAEVHQLRQQLGAAGQGWEVARGEAVIERERRAHADAEMARMGAARERMRQELADARQELAEARGMEPFGLVWRPKPGSHRWQHRMGRDGRSYPATAEFVDVYRVTEDTCPTLEEDDAQ